MAMMTISLRLTNRRGDDKSLSGTNESHIPPVGAPYAPPDPAGGGGRG